MSKEFKPGPADETEISLSQAILSPLNALFKAQVHAARSFINLLFQVGYPHVPINPDTGMPDISLAEDPKAAEDPYELKFIYKTVNQENGQETRYDINVPALALVPLNSLAIETGEFKFGLKVTSIENYEQMQQSRVDLDKSAEKTKPEGQQAAGDKRPWYLVANPISLRGNITSSISSKQSSEKETTIDIYIKVSRSPVPAALDSLLTSLTQSVSLKNKT